MAKLKDSDSDYDSDSEAESKSNAKKTLFWINLNKNVIIIIIIDFYCFLLLLMIIIDYYYGDHLLLLMIVLLLLMIIGYCNKTNFSSSMYKVIRPVLNFLYFFYDKISEALESTINMLVFFRIRFCQL